jgi:transcriptional regulator with XRE-family HTH domain
MNSVAKTFANVIRTLRVSKGLSQKAVGVKAGLSLYKYRKIENGITDPELMDIFAIAKGLKVPPSQIIQLVGDRLVYNSD